MKNILNKLFLLCIGATLMFNACKKQENKAYYSVKKAKTTLQASATAVVLTKVNAGETVLSFSWSKPDFGYNAGVSYTLLFDRPADSFKKTAQVTVGANLLTSSYTVAQINQIATKFGMTPDSSGVILVHLMAMVNQNGGQNVGNSAGLDTIYSDTIQLKVTPYSDSVIYPHVYAVGAFQGWSPTTGIAIYSFNSDSKYEGYVNITGTGSSDFEFKFTSETDWNGTNYGSDGTTPTTTGFVTTGTVSTAGSAGNLTVPAAGYYRLKLDATGLTYEAYQTTWGVIGDATPNGWNASTPLTYDPVKNVWVIESIALTAGGAAIKFRANDAWDLSYGYDATNTKLTSDNGANIPVATAGNYKIVLDLSNSTNYNFTLTKL